MYGWRGRIGLVVPSSNTTMESELVRMLPRGISVHTSRMIQILVTEDELMRMADSAMRAAKELASADVDVIVYGCTSGSFSQGEAWNEEFTQKLIEGVGKPVVTASTAVHQALVALGMNKICLVTPYSEETNQRARIWLESLGLKVAKTVELVKSTSSQPISDLEIGRIAPEEVYTKVKKEYPPGSDGIFISCTNVRTFEIIDVLEADLGIAVVTSNQASMWAALKVIGCRDLIDGLGKLFKRQGYPPSL